MCWVLTWTICGVIQMDEKETLKNDEPKSVQKWGKDNVVRRGETSSKTLSFISSGTRINVTTNKTLSNYYEICEGGVPKLKHRLPVNSNHILSSTSFGAKWPSNYHNHYPLLRSLKMSLHTRIPTFPWVYRTFRVLWRTQPNILHIRQDKDAIFSHIT